MEIHHPEGPTHSWKDFAIHIFIVTVGSLIALGLEGVREMWREHYAVAEARERFHQELTMDRRQLELEIASVDGVNQTLKKIMAELPEAAKTPNVLKNQMEDFTLGFYFFRSTAWESAVASGVVAHMSSEEVNRFADVYNSVRNYQEAQKMALPEWIGVQSTFRSHSVLTPAEQSEAYQKLVSFQIRMAMLRHVAREFSADIDKAIAGR